MVRRKLSSLSVLLLALASLCAPASAQVYQWRDEQGRLHFSDRHPDHGHDLPEQAAPARAQRSGLVQFEREDFSLSPAAREQVTRGLEGILSIYTRELGLDVRGEVVVR